MCKHYIVEIYIQNIKMAIKSWDHATSKNGNLQLWCPCCDVHPMLLTYIKLLVDIEIGMTGLHLKY